MTKFNFVVCGGTFDLFHAGHKSFIEDALTQSEKVPNQFLAAGSAPDFYS